MNFFSHAARFLDADPLFVAGTAVPDWLAMIDRPARVRRAAAVEQCSATDPAARELARGIAQHFTDDEWFHQSPAFAELQVVLTRQLADRLGGETRFRPHFVAHIVIEMLLDASLAEVTPAGLARYYSRMTQVDPERLQSLVNQLAARPTTRLAEYLPRFIHEGFLHDYARDEGIAYRTNRILAAAGLPAMPATFPEWVAAARSTVWEVRAGLLDPPTGQPRFELAGSSRKLN
jgi:hypothetical protein